MSKSIEERRQDRAMAFAEQIIEFSTAPRMRPSQIEGLAQFLVRFAEHELKLDRLTPQEPT